IMGKSLTKGTVLGRVVSPYTFEILDEIKAPFDKTEVMMIRNRISKVHPGEYAYIIGDGDSGYDPRA
ncbi:MAG: succinate dehydrogenase, partial [Chelatococcus sp.]|nr:succinate dehydrogenase [Chelatococcus sp.]